MMPQVLQIIPFYLETDVKCEFYDIILTNATKMCIMCVVMI